MVRAALINIGNVLTANKMVEIDPASTARVAMSRRYGADVSARVGFATHLSAVSYGWIPVGDSTSKGALEGKEGLPPMER